METVSESVAASLHHRRHKSLLLSSVLGTGRRQDVLKQSAGLVDHRGNLYTVQGGLLQSSFLRVGLPGGREGGRREEEREGGGEGGRERWREGGRA